MLFDDQALLGQLIGYDTVSSRSNLALVDFIAEYLDGQRPRIYRWLDAQGNKANLLLHFGPDVAASRAGLTLCGHLDVVPPGGDWQSDPFALRDDDALLYGRGVADMKGFIALAVNLAREIKIDDLRAPLILLLTRDEEIGTLGARDLVAEWSSDWQLPRAMIIGEPSELKPVLAHKGHLQLELTVFGLSAHGGYPHLGKNAIELAGRAVGALAELRQQLQAERPKHAERFPDVPYVALNIGTIDGGAAINVVPERCSLGIGLRPLPEMTADTLRARVQAALAIALPEDSFALTLKSESPPMLSSAHSELSQHISSESGVDASSTDGMCFATDGGWLQQLDVDCLIYGPGSITVAHKPNECLDKTDLVAAKDVLSRLIHRHCC